LLKDPLLCLGLKAHLPSIALQLLARAVVFPFKSVEDFKIEITP